ncbi:MAG TPA: PD-(D/E)XK nuclease family protein [Acidimicrobiales bacterium]|nr:PD-(D/E)XK nuclease family protein [Acidimicrobiales bacterium]
MSAAPPRTLADVLAAPGEPAGGDADLDLGTLRARLDDAARRATALAGWTEDEPLRLTKSRVTWLLRCPRRAVAVPDESASDDLVAGLIVDAAAKLATLVPQRPPTAEAAVEFLAATGEERVADRPDAVRQAAVLVERLAAAWPAVDPAWWPRVEEPARVRLAEGAVTVSGRVDLIFGGPPTPRTTIVVEVKAGRWYDGMRADAHLYALLVALRDRRPPAAVVTVVADGTTQVEPVRPAVLDHAAERVEEALMVAAALAAGEVPAVHPGPHCPHCPARPGCPAGQAWRPRPETVRT